MSSFFGILLALLCALATNVGFLYKHRGACAAPAVNVRKPIQSAKALFASPLFTIGWIIGTGAWVFHVAAMSVAPLSLVQAVLAGGMVMLAIMAEQMLGCSIGRRQWIGLALTAFGLMLLGFTLPAAHGADSHFSIPGMIAFETVLIAAGGLLIMGPSMGAPEHHHGYMMGAASGILFGVSDVAIKAISGMVGSHGFAGLLTPWLLVCVAASVAAFYSSAKGLQDGDAVPVIAVTGTAANVAGIVGGFIVFGDPLPGSPVALGLQCFAFVLVLGAAWLMPGPIRAAVGPAVAAAPPPPSTGLPSVGIHGAVPPGVRAGRGVAFPSIRPGRRLVERRAPGERVGSSPGSDRGARACVTRQSTSDRPTVAYRACPTCVVGHGRAVDARVAGYACSASRLAPAAQPRPLSRCPPLKNPICPRPPRDQRPPGRARTRGIRVRPVRGSTASARIPLAPRPHGRRRRRPILRIGTPPFRSAQLPGPASGDTVVQIGTRLEEADGEHRGGSSDRAEHAPGAGQAPSLDALHSDVGVRRRT